MIMMCEEFKLSRETTKNTQKIYRCGRGASGFANQQSPRKRSPSLTADVLDSAVPAMERTAILFNRQHDRADSCCDVLVMTGRDIEDRMLIMVVCNSRCCYFDDCCLLTVLNKFCVAVFANNLKEFSE